MNHQRFKSYSHDHIPNVGSRVMIILFMFLGDENIALQTTFSPFMNLPYSLIEKISMQKDKHLTKDYHFLTDDARE